MSMRGLYKSTGYWNTVQARKDWQRLASEAVLILGPAEVQKYLPPFGAGWRTIDKKIAQLRAAMAEKQKEMDR